MSPEGGIDPAGMCGQHFSGGGSSSSTGPPELRQGSAKGKGTQRNHFPPEKLFVARLPRAASEQAVKAHFEQFGPVLKVELKLGEDGLSKGFGFVTFQHAASANKVVANYSENRFEGRWIAVEQCVPQDGTVEGKQRSDPLTAPERIFLGNLPRGTTEDMVRKVLEGHGKIADIDLKYDPDDGAFRGFGFVTFESKEVAELVLEHHNRFVLQGRMIHCRRSQKFDRASKDDEEMDKTDNNQMIQVPTKPADGAATNGGAAADQTVMVPLQCMNMFFSNMMSACGPSGNMAAFGMNPMAASMMGGMGFPAAMMGCMGMGGMGMGMGMPCMGMGAGMNSGALSGASAISSARPAGQGDPGGGPGGVGCGRM